MSEATREVAVTIVPAVATVERSEFVVRRFEATISQDGDGRTIEGKVVPYNVRTSVSDPPDFQPYDEEFVHGVFRASVKAPNRVLLDFEHYGATNDLLGSTGSIAGTLGWATALEEREDGLYGTFRIGNHPDGDKALELVRAGVLGGFSVAAKPLRSLRSADGAMQRVKAHLDRVSLCRVGAYSEAKVLSLRAEVVDEKPVHPPLAAFPAGVADSIDRLGLRVPESLR